MASPIIPIESALNDFKHQGATFGPDSLTIKEVIKAHNGFSGSTIVSRNTGSEFYNGLRCTFGVFVIVFLSNEGNAFHKDGIVNVTAEIYLKEEEIDNLQYQTVFTTLHDLVEHLPSKEVGIEYKFPGTSVSITLEQWNRIEHGADQDVAGGDVTLDAIKSFLIEAAESNSTIILTDEKGESCGRLTYDQAQDKFNAVP